MRTCLALSLILLGAMGTIARGAEPTDSKAPAAEKAPVAETGPADEKAPTDSKATADAPKPAWSQTISVKTIDDEQFDAPGGAIRDGALVLQLEPPKTIPLNTIERVSFSSKTDLSAEWIGQDNHDKVQIGVAEGGNGIQDVHIRLKGISNRQQIKQLRIVCPSPPRAWRLNPAESPDWLLALERVGNASEVDVYFEPPGDDLFDHELQITATFKDGSTAKTTLDATSYTSDAAKVVAKSETQDTPKATAKTEPSAATQSTTAPSTTAASTIVHLEGNDVLRGILADFGEEQLTIAPSWRPKLDVPLLHVRGILFDHATPEAKARYEEVRTKPDAEDRVVLLAKDGKLAEISGRVKQMAEHQIVVSYQNEDRKIDLPRVQAIVFAAHPSVRAHGQPSQVVTFSSGDILSGVWKTLNDKQIELQTPWDSTLEVPIGEVTHISGSSGKIVELSDLEPASAEQTPYFGRATPYGRDHAIGGGPLKLGDKTYAKGLAVHSRCVLTYDLDGQYAEFRTTVGFDPAAGQHGRVVCRVLADGAELFAKPDLRATDPPSTLALPVAGAKQLTLEVDFGEDEDVQDRVIWAAPRLVKK